MKHANGALPPSISMRWHDLAFLHWRIEPALLRGLVPRELEIDTFDGSSWIGLVPFEMRDSRFRGYPDLPSLRQFYECNVRTYVSHQGCAGVWFFSLDAQRLIPVLGARALWSLNYHWSAFDVRRNGSVTDYRLRRRGTRGAAHCHVVWERGARMQPSQAGSLEHFLTERFYLFSRRRGRILRSRVAHEPWTLHEARIAKLEENLIASLGLRVEGAPIAWCSEGVDVDGWGLVPCGRVAR